MTTIIIVAIIAAVVYYIYYLSHCNHKESDDSWFQEPPKNLLDLTTTTVAERQRAYGHSFNQQLQFDELQRRAEASGDNDTLEAIRLGTYNGPLPNLKEDAPTLAISHSNGNPNAPVQKLKYFCIKNKCYHVSVWPKDHYQPDIIEFDIAGMSYRENIDDYLGEFKGTLEPDPTNEYDPNAIKVLAHDGHHVGYVPKDMTAEVRRYANLPCLCYFYIGENDGIYFSDCYIELSNVSPLEL